MGFEVKNPRHSGEGMIDVDLFHPRWGWIPYTAIDNSGEDEMQAIWDGLMRGDYGPVAPEAD